MFQISHFYGSFSNDIMAVKGLHKKQNKKKKKKIVLKCGVRDSLQHSPCCRESEDVLPKTNYNWAGLFYVTDFYATLVGLIKDDTKSKTLEDITDSYNQWKYIKKVN